MLGRLRIFFSILIIVGFGQSTAYAINPVNSSSTNYKVNQVLFGFGGENPNTPPTSANYSASQVALGETGVGNYTSPTYQAYAGFNTNDAPFLELVVTATNLNLGLLSKSSTATATATFYVRAWNSSGYIVQTVGSAPTNGAYTMLSPATPTSPTVGTEQFGMNIVANTSPITFGANPSQTTTFSYGAAFGNYATTNKFLYNDGDEIASAPSSTSSTVYTLSYIFNISGNTPGGTYTFNQSIVATAGY